jgi:uncharacterized protein YoxC
MPVWLVHLGGALPQAAAALPDTFYMKPLAAEPGLFERVASVASGLVSISLVVLTVALVPAAWNFRKSYKRINALLERVYGDISPIMRHTSSIADNVDYVTTAVRGDIERVSHMIRLAEERVERAVEGAERRLNDFNALLDVVQEEAEGVFLTTASTVRGVRRGAATLRGGVAEGTNGAEQATEETIDGDDDSDAPEGGLPRPRIRARGARRA